jgi:peptide/nickel transport system substrate-binding protein
MAAKLNRRNFLRSAAMTAAGMALAACAQPTPQVVKETVVVEKPVEKIVKETVVVKETVIAKQTVLVEKAVPVEKVITATPAPMTYKEAPMLAELVTAGKLQPVKDRLPSNPLVVDVLEEIGQYGGTWRRAYKGVSDRWGTEKIVVENLLMWRMPQGGAITIVPNVVDKWDVSADGKDYTWYLRKGIKWSDGKPLTTADAKFWYEDLFSTTLRDTYGVNATYFNVGGKPMVIEVVDDFTFKTRFAAANPLLPIFICVGTGNYTGNRGPNFCAPAHFYKQFHPKYGKKEDLDALVKKFNLKVVDDLLTSGTQSNLWFLNPDVPTIHPWISKNSPSTSQDLYISERNPYYWQVDKQGNQLPYLDRVTYRFFDNQETFNFWLIGGEIDSQNRHISAADYTLFKQNEAKGGYRTILWREAATLSYFICCDYDKDPVLQKILNDLRFRQAFSLAINRQEINDVVFQGMYKPRQACPVTGSPDHNADWEKYYAQYDPAAANKLLDEMGLDKKGADGIRLRSDGKPLEIILEFATVAFAGTADMHQFTAEYLKKVGVKLTLKSEERSLWEARQQSDDIQIFCWVRDRSAIPIADPGEFINGGGANGVWGTYYTTGGKSGVKPPDGGDFLKVREMWSNVLVEPDEKKRQALWQQLLDFNKTNLWVIGVCGEAPSPFITKNNFRNVPTGLVQDDPLRGERLGMTQTYFIKK